MNFKQLDRLLTETLYDEVKIIGKDVTLDGHYAHIIGMTRKGKQAFVYALEFVEQPENEEETVQRQIDKTHRQQMKENYKTETNPVFLQISEFHSNGKVFRIDGATASATEFYNLAEHMLFYLKMKEHGWTMPEESPLCTVDWERLRLSVIELEELDELPDWTNDLQIVKSSQNRTEALEIPLVLTCGEQPVIPFQLEDGTPAECYINKICLYDVWAEQERRFEDTEYRKRALEYVSMEKFQQMKQQLEDTLLASCPRGMCYMLVEYECHPDAAINFYATSYLDARPQISSGSASALLMIHHPDAATGSHGLKLRGCIIQTPVAPETASLHAELFSYTELVKQNTIKVW